MRNRIFLTFILVVAQVTGAMAQCAMCKTTIVNNVSNGELALADGLNFGIMYLFVTPYLAIALIGGIWFYKYKRHGKKKFNTSAA
ncbi:MULTISPECIES: hypothetical protein [Reichenbachiella]|uniref:Uncharacterized protein n=1 Tax=Reichenbachiella agariperforans TaxID=156994 RepID=A0A1M6RF65_REIAG|nr:MULTISPECIES: hypothetical protein [Reichenbachiella]MBU2915346.1 hypothetical protein [Reichenbachiella agariperforans]RJE70568.1 hypothetical protein BGP76_10800 [Reichenbachiella sp. MSK19-1]SHK31114.1 hypothetical protein SAMN04488028_104151 [Reichenbachiella agariperforans]